MDKLIPSFSVENAISFFKKNIRSFKTESEDFSHILKSDDLEKFSLVKKIGEASLDGSGDLLVFTAKFNGDLSERTSKKIQFEIAKKILKNDFKDGAIFIFYDKTGNFRFSFIRRNMGIKKTNIPIGRDTPILLIKKRQIKPSKTELVIVLFLH